MSSVLEAAQSAIRKVTETARSLLQHAVPDSTIDSTHISTVTSNSDSIGTSIAATTTNAQKKKRRKKNSQKEKRKRKKLSLEAKEMRRVGIEGMLSTTHVMISNGATSKKVRSVVGEAIADVNSKQGTMQKEKKKERAWMKRTTNTMKASSNRAPTEIRLYDRFNFALTTNAIVCSSLHRCPYRNQMRMIR